MSKKNQAQEKVSQDVGDKMQSIQRLWKEKVPDIKLIHKLIHEIW